MKNVALVVVLASSLALADGTPLDVELGKTIERSVSYATGWMCDEPSLVDASIVTRGDHNVWSVTGKKLGTTLCRVGTDPYRPSSLFQVHVVPAKKR